MCGACVAEGVVYVGGALAGLQVMAARARAKRSPRPSKPLDGGQPGLSNSATAPAGQAGWNPQPPTSTASASSPDAPRFAEARSLASGTSR
jgi:hypothetical protein